MKKLLHPLGILAIAACPFVLYSVRRTGYQIAHLFDVRLLGTRYLWEVVLLTSAVVACCFCYRKKAKPIFSVASIAAVSLFVALQAFEDHSADYKLWIFIVAPIFAWSLVFSSGLMLAFRKE